MGEMTTIPAGNVERFPLVENARAVSDELAKLEVMIKAACPEATAIHFDFDGKLRVRIDVHSRDDVAAIQKTLPGLGGGGLFYGLTLGATPHSPFHHRVSALVDR
ncbi:hypothetical protein FHW96_005202 [Novosphingobium sp. SG751A]|uniref:hypothetical protein n=1 Tax=Novosphingobium sp. SG751A TaxID=2587000 RepID=UPI0020A68AF4|nr:hypothetical protein [Novosphingobium sp. SG751A]NOW49012.1 hypothetical protein [Novosphingobium sp. SG751A]